jgi:rod shape determining protein RodA
MWNLQQWQRQDWLLTLLITLLSGVGLLAVFSTTYFPDRTISSDFWQQLLFMAVGFCLYHLILCTNGQWWQSKVVAISLYISGLISLIVLYIIPNSGVRRWIRIAGFSFQPSEYAKLVLIVVVSYLLARSQSWKLEIRSKTIVIAPWLQALLAIIPIAFLVWRQPSLGNTLLLLGIVGFIWLTQLQNPWIWAASFGLLSAGIVLVNVQLHPQTIVDVALKAGILLLPALGFSIVSRKFNYLLIVAVIAGLLAGGLINFGWTHLLSAYQQERVTSFLNPAEDPLGGQWQVNQAKIAIGSALMWGKGFLQGTQANSGLLPYAYTDFIYAASVEQFGIWASIVLLGLIAAICWRGVDLASRLQSTQAKLIIAGVVTMLLLNTVVNVGMNLGLMPVTGVPLPLVSYGGSAVLINLVSLGVVQSLVASETNRPKSQKLGIQPKFRYNSDTLVKTNYEKHFR